MTAPTSLDQKHHSPAFANHVTWTSDSKLPGLVSGSSVPSPPWVGRWKEGTWEAGSVRETWQVLTKHGVSQLGPLYSKLLSEGWKMRSLSATFQNWRRWGTAKLSAGPGRTLSLEKVQTGFVGFTRRVGDSRTMGLLSHSGGNPRSQCYQPVEQTSRHRAPVLGGGRAEAERAAI